MKRHDRVHPRTPSPAPAGSEQPGQGALGYFDRLQSVLRAFEVSDNRGLPLTLDAGTELAVSTVVEAAERGHKVLLVGNGGSAAIVSHAQADLVKAARIPALCFNEAPLLTAYANDEGYENAFEGIASHFVARGDVLWAVSSAGRSPNILRAATTCAARGATVITMSGFAANNPLRGLGHLNFYAGAAAYGMVELAHACLSHYLTDKARDRRRPVTK